MLAAGHMISVVRAWGACAGLVAAAAVAAGAAPASAAVEFGEPHFRGLFQAPFGIEATELNGDGHPDLVAGGSGEVGSLVTVLLGDGHGGFPRAEQYELEGRAAFGLTVADLDGDGHPDVATALLEPETGGGKNVGIELGEGGSALHEPTYLSTGEKAGPLAIAAGRFSGGAHPDLVVADGNADNVALLENKSTPGALSFAPAKFFAPTRAAFAFAVADFNRDGIPDLAVDDSGEGGVSGFTILPGTGKSGGFVGPGSFTPLGQNVDAIASGDFNGDGWPDLAFVNIAFSKSAVYVLLNDGKGGFEAPVTYDLGKNPRSIATAQIGGVTDLLVSEATGTVLLLANNGAGGFTEAARYPTQESWGPVLGSDLNGDGAGDITEGNFNDTLATLLNIGVPTPSPSSLSFGSQPKGSETAPQNVTITNTGAAPTTIEGLGLAGADPGQFDLDDASLAFGAGNCTGATLPAGGSCAANAAFRPSQEGERSATLLIYSEGSSAPASVALGGTGAPPAVPPPPPPPGSGGHGPLPPAFSLATLGHPHPGARSLTVRASCAVTCLLHLKLTVSHSVVKRLHLKSATIATLNATVSGARLLRVKLSSALAKRLSKLHALTIFVSGSATFLSSTATAHVNLALKH